MSGRTLRTREAPTLVARVHHVCTVCRQDIPPGTTYKRGAIKNLDTNEITTEKLCATCLKGVPEEGWPPTSLSRFVAYYEPHDD